MTVSETEGQFVIFGQLAKQRENHVDRGGTMVVDVVRHLGNGGYSDLATICDVRRDPCDELDIAGSRRTTFWPVPHSHFVDWGLVH